MPQAKNGDSVAVNYTGRLNSGLVFDTTENRQPLQFVVGQGQIIEGFEQAVLGMSPGESKTVKLAPDDAYGPRRDEMVVALDRGHVPGSVEPQIGQRLELQRHDGSRIDATVTEVTESSIVVDANHPLAGEVLTFEITLLDVA